MFVTVMLYFFYFVRMCLSKLPQEKMFLTRAKPTRYSNWKVNNLNTGTVVAQALCSAEKQWKHTGKGGEASQLDSQVTYHKLVNKTFIFAKLKKQHLT